MFQAVLKNSRIKYGKKFLEFLKSPVQLLDKTIPQAKLMHRQDTSHGLDTEALVKFVAKNCKQEHVPALRMTVETMDEFIRASGINFRDFYRFQLIEF